MHKLWIVAMVIALLLTSCIAGTGVDESSTVSSVAETIATNETEERDYEVLFEDGMIHELYIDIDEASWSEILENPTEEAYYSADITVDGITVENVGFRTKGNSTLRDVANSDSDRYSFKFKINEYEDQKLLGLDEFVVNNMYSDASYMREYFSYESMAVIGSTVSLTTYTNVYINEDLFGFYLMVESVDDSFLNRNFGNNDGNLYRMDQGSSLSITDGKYNENANQKNGEDESKNDLYNLMDVLNDMTEGEKGAIESVLDVESALLYIAANTLLESYDSLNGSFAQNYYLYNNNGIFTVIPWDYNMSFGTFGGSGVSTVAIDEPVLGTTMEKVPLIDKLLAVEEYREMYYDILREFINYFDSFEADVTELRSLIEEHVENDPTKFSSIEDFRLSTIYQEDGAIEAGLMNGTPGGDMGQRPQDQVRPNRDNYTPPEGSSPPAGKTPPEELDDKNGRPAGMNIRGGNDVSIINILQARIENIQTQLNE